MSPPQFRFLSAEGLLTAALWRLFAEIAGGLVVCFGSDTRAKSAFKCFAMFTESIITVFCLTKPGAQMRRGSGFSVAEQPRACARGVPATARHFLRSVRRERCAAFTFVEVLVAIGIVGVLITALYAAIANSVSLVRNCQENERVTQILSDKLDTIRLYNWTQINSNGFIPTNFTVGIDPLTNSTPYYTGAISIAQAPMASQYRSNILQVTVQVNWVSGRRPQSRRMDTFVAKYGLQSYIMR